MITLKQAVKSAIHDAELADYDTESLSVEDAARLLRDKDLWLYPYSLVEIGAAIQELRTLASLLGWARDSKANDLTGPLTTRDVSELTWDKFINEFLTTREVSELTWDKFINELQQRLNE